MRTALRVLRPVYRINRKARWVLVFAIVFGLFWLHVYGHINWWSFIGLWILAYNFVFLPEAITSYCEYKGKYKNPRLSIEHCTWALELDPTNEIAFIHLTNCYMILGMIEDAYHVINTALSHAPKNADLYCRRAYMNYHYGNLEGMVADADKALKLAPNLPYAKYMQLLKFIMQANHQEALSLLTSSDFKGFFPKDLDCLKYFCLIHLNQIDLAEETIAPYANTPLHNRLSANKFLHNGDYADVLAISSDPAMPKEYIQELAYLKAISLLRLGEPGLVYRMAMDEQRKGTIADIDYSALLIMSAASAAQIDEICFAVINYLRSRKLLLLACEVQEAWIYLTRGQFTEVKELVDGWEKLGYRGESYYCYKSMLLTKEGLDLQSAVQVAEMACERFPASYDARLALGAALTASGAHERAIEVLENWLQIQPLSFECYKYLAAAYEANGEQEKAEETVKRGASLMALYRNELKQAIQDDPFTFELEPPQTVALTALPTV